jgi:hypothetical protein
MFRKIVLILALVTGLFSIAPAHAGGEKWDAWSYDSQTGQLILHRPGGGVFPPLALPSAPGYNQFPYAVTLSNKWDYIAYVQSNQDASGTSAMLSVYDRNAQKVAFTYALPGGLTLGDVAFTDDNSALALGFSKVDNPNSPAWTLLVLSVPTGGVVSTLKSSDPAAASLPHNFAMTPVTEVLRDKRVVFMMVQGMADGPLAAPSFIWDFGAGTVTPLPNLLGGSTDVYQPTGEIVYGGRDARFPVCDTCSPMGGFNALSVYNPVSNSATNFFTSGDSALGAPLFIQNGERILVSMTQAGLTSDSFKTRYAVLERSGMIAGYLPDSTVFAWAVGTQDGFVYLTIPDAGQPTSLVEVTTRGGITVKTDWTGTLGSAVRLIKTPGNMTGTGPFIAWGQVSASAVAAAPTATVPGTVPTSGAPATLKIGGTATVQTTQGDVLRMHSGPGLTFAIVKQLPNGTKVSILEGPHSADGLNWWRIREPGGVSGWVVDSVTDNGSQLQTLIPN